jgi:hypothetical protein
MYIYIKYIWFLNVYFETKMTHNHETIVIASPCPLLGSSTMCAVRKRVFFFFFIIIKKNSVVVSYPPKLSWIVVVVNCLEAFRNEYSPQFFFCKICSFGSTETHTSFFLFTARQVQSLSTTAAAHSLSLENGESQIIV